MIKTLLFDNNGVFTTNDAQGTYKKLAAYFDVAEEELKPTQDRVAEDLDEGKISTEEFYDIIQKQIGTNKDKEELKEIHLSCYQIREDVISYAQELSDKYELAMLTNFGDYFDDANSIHWNLERVFPREKIFVSAKIGMRKPNANFYEYALKKLSKNPEEVVFIDDREENVRAAVDLGLKGILFTNLETFKKDFKELEESGK